LELEDWQLFSYGTIALEMPRRIGSFNSSQTYSFLREVSEAIRQKDTVDFNIYQYERFKDEAGRERI